MAAPWKIVFAFVGVFVAGAVFGGFFTLRVNPAPAAVAAGPANGERKEPAAATPGPVLRQIGAAMFRQYVQRLNLTDEQREKIRPIVARAEEDLQRIRRQNFQETTRVMDRLHSDVAAWLTPEQRENLETIRRNMRDRLRRAQEPGAHRGGARATGGPGELPGGATAAADERKGN